MLDENKQRENSMMPGVKKLQAANEKECAYFALLPWGYNEEVARMRLGDTKGSLFLGRSCNIKDGAALN